MCRWPACVVLASVLAAQPPIPSPSDQSERAVVEPLLRSKDPAQAAWGAFLAANYQQPVFIPQIVTLLGWQNPDLQLVALDALIRLKASVPSPQIHQFRQGLALNAAIVLAVRNLAEHGTWLIGLLDTPLEDGQWVAIHTLLAASPPQGFAARLLREWHIPIRLVVYDETRNGIGSGVSAVSGISDSVPVYRQDFPPIHAYRLTERPRAGDLYLAGPPPTQEGHPVFYGPLDGGNSFGLNRDQYRGDYLRSMAGMTRAATSFLPSGFIAIEFKDQNGFVREALAARLRVVVGLQPLKEKLVAQGLLAQSEADAGPQLEMVVSDQRAVGSHPLPVIE